MQEKKMLTAGLWFNANNGALDMDAWNCILEWKRIEDEKKLEKADKSRKRDLDIIKQCAAVINKKGLDHSRWTVADLKAVVKYLRASSGPKIVERKKDLLPPAQGPKASATNNQP